MEQTRMSLEQMNRLYPNEYLFITDFARDGADILEGIVVVHSPSIRDVYKASSEYKGHAAIHYTGELFPEGMVIL